jgi:hypothetical protein
MIWLELPIGRPQGGLSDIAEWTGSAIAEPHRD